MFLTIDFSQACFGLIVPSNFGAFYDWYK